MEFVNEITFKKYTEYSDEFLSFCKDNNIKTLFYLLDIDFDEFDR